MYPLNKNGINMQNRINLMKFFCLILKRQPKKFNLKGFIPYFLLELTFFTLILDHSAIGNQPVSK